MTTDTYRRRILTALRASGEPAAGPRTRVILPLLLAGIAVYLVVAILAAPSGYREKYFIEEPGLVNALSAVLLAAAAAFAAVVASVQRRGRSLWFWGLMAAGFAFFGLDELVQGHEKVGGKLDEILGGSGGFRNMGDVIVIAYGLLAIAILVYFLPEFLSNSDFARFAIVGFVFYAAQTGIDALATDRTTMSAIIEESAKLIASGFFALASYRAAMAVVTATKDPEAIR